MNRRQFLRMLDGMTPQESESALARYATDDDPNLRALAVKTRFDDLPTSIQTKLVYDENIQVRIAAVIVAGHPNIQTEDDYRLVIAAMRRPNEDARVVAQRIRDAIHNEQDLLHSKLNVIFEQISSLRLPKDSMCHEIDEFYSFMLDMAIEWSERGGEASKCLQTVFASASDPSITLRALEKMHPDARSVAPLRNNKSERKILSKIRRATRSDDLDLYATIRNGAVSTAIMRSPHVTEHQIRMTTAINESSLSHIAHCRDIAPLDVLVEALKKGNPDALICKNFRINENTAHAVKVGLRNAIAADVIVIASRIAENESATSDLLNLAIVEHLDATKDMSWQWWGSSSRYESGDFFAACASHPQANSETMHLITERISRSSDAKEVIRRLRAVAEHDLLIDYLSEFAVSRHDEVRRQAVEDEDCPEERRVFGAML